MARLICATFCCDRIKRNGTREIPKLREQKRKKRKRKNKIERVWERKERPNWGVCCCSWWIGKRFEGNRSSPNPRTVTEFVCRDWGKHRKLQDIRLLDQDLNPGPPENDSRELPLRQPAHCIILAIEGSSFGALCRQVPLVERVPPVKKHWPSMRYQEAAAMVAVYDFS
jgi:hypothetical protein